MLSIACRWKGLAIELRKRALETEDTLTAQLMHARADMLDSCALELLKAYLSEKVDANGPT